jgi:GH25 family lysozyme M1 (1,4-beta-N-acetylmuramidase)
MASDSVAIEKLKYVKAAREKRFRDGRNAMTERIFYLFADASVEESKFASMIESAMGFPIGWTDLEDSEMQ